MKVTLLRGTFTICRLDPGADAPGWALVGAFVSITRTHGELSIVCASDLVPPGIRAEPGWCCFEVEGPLEFAMTGVLASLSGALSKAGISLFAISTFDTDYILVKDAEAARRAFQGAGHTVLSEGMSAPS